VWLDLLSTFVLTLVTYGASDPNFVSEDVQWVVASAPNIACGVGPCRMLPLACRFSDGLDPDLDPVWIMLWSITVVILLILIVFLHCAPS
jgi:hypothetical protein